MNAVEDVTNAVVMARNNSVVRGDAQRQTPQPLVQCAACHQEPVEPVETPCCGDVWCWRCAVERPYFIETHCVCGQPLALEDFRPAKAIKTLLRRNRGPSTPRDLSYDDVLPCPENCGAVLPAWSFEDHIRTCLQVIEPCPNGCDDRHVKRMDMADHVRDHCPLTIAPCKFGCNQVIPRKEMEDHMRNNMAAHLDQLLATVEAQNAAIAQLKALHQPERELPSAGGEAQNVEIDQLRAEAMRQRIRIDQLEHQKARVAHCGNFLMRRRRLVIMVLFLLALLALVGIPLVVKIVVAGGAMAGLHWGFKRWLRGVQMNRPPFRTTETNILFGMLCVAICFSLWPLIFLFFKL